MTLPGQFYTVAFEGLSVTNANGTHDLFYLEPADDRPVVITGINIDVYSETGEAEEEQLRLKAIRGHTSASSGGTAATARGLLGSAPSAAGTYRYGDTTVATGGTAVDLAAWAFNVRSGFIWLPTPEQYLTVDQGDASIAIRLMAAVTDDVSMNGTIHFCELG